MLGDNGPLPAVKQDEYESADYRTLDVFASEEDRTLDVGASILRSYRLLDTEAAALFRAAELAGEGRPAQSNLTCWSAG
jgi:hypothetical protein